MQKLENYVKARLKNLFQKQGRRRG